MKQKLAPEGSTWNDKVIEFGLFKTEFNFSLPLDSETEKALNRLSHNELQMMAREIFPWYRLTIETNSFASFERCQWIIDCIVSHPNAEEERSQ